MKQHWPLSKKDCLLCLFPFFESGLLRVGGGTKRSSLPFDAKHPIILDSKEHSIQLYIQKCHEVCMHIGVEYTRNYTTETPHSWNQSLPEKFGFQMFRLSPLPNTGTTATDGRPARHSFPGNAVTSHLHQCRRGLLWTACRRSLRCRSEDLHLLIHLLGYKSNSPGGCRGPQHGQVFDSNLTLHRSTRPTALVLVRQRIQFPGSKKADQKKTTDVRPRIHQRSAPEPVRRKEA